MGDINTIRKEEGLTWHTFRQILIENYSNIPHMSDAVVAYMQLTHQDYESTSQYLIRAKALLEHMNHTSELSLILGNGMNNLGLVWGIKRLPHQEESCKKKKGILDYHGGCLLNH